MAGIAVAILNARELMIISKLMVAGLCAVASGVLLISGMYIWVLPTLFPGTRTYLVLVLGLVAVASATGYYASRSRSEPTGWPPILAFSATTTIVTLILVLYLVANLRGS